MLKPADRFFRSASGMLCSANIGCALGELACRFQQWVEASIVLTDSLLTLIAVWCKAEAILAPPNSMALSCSHPSPAARYSPVWGSPSLPCTPRLPLSSIPADFCNFLAPSACLIWPFVRQLKTSPTKNCYARLEGRRPGIWSSTAFPDLSYPHLLFNSSSLPPSHFCPFSCPELYWFCLPPNFLEGKQLLHEGPGWEVFSAVGGAKAFEGSGGHDSRGSRVQGVQRGRDEGDRWV